MDEKYQNWAKIAAKLWFSKLKNSINFSNFTTSNIVKFPMLANSWNKRIFGIVRFRKLEKYQNLTIWKTIIPKIHNAVNYHIF